MSSGQLGCPHCGGWMQLHHFTTRNTWLVMCADCAQPVVEEGSWSDVRQGVASAGLNFPMREEPPGGQSSATPAVALGNEVATKYGSLTVESADVDHVAVAGHLVIRQGGYAVSASLARSECDEHVMDGIASAHFHTTAFRAYRHRSQRYATDTAASRLRQEVEWAINVSLAPTQPDVLTLGSRQFGRSPG